MKTMFAMFFDIWWFTNPLLSIKNKSYHILAEICIAAVLDTIKWVFTHIACCERHIISHFRYIAL